MFNRRFGGAKPKTEGVVQGRPDRQTLLLCNVDISIRSKKLLKANIVKPNVRKKERQLNFRSINNPPNGQAGIIHNLNTKTNNNEGDVANTT